MSDAIDISKFLVNSATPKKKGSGKDIPEVDCGDLGDKVYRAYVAQRDAKAEFDALESQMLEKVRVNYEAGANRTFAKTLNVAGHDTPGVQVSFKDAFTKIPIDREPFLKAELGNDYDRFFVQKREISLLDTSDDTVALLLSKLGPEEFKRLFDIGLSVQCRPDMDRNQFLLPKNVRDCLVQYKGATKARSNG